MNAARKVYANQIKFECEMSIAQEYPPNQLILKHRKQSAAVLSSLILILQSVSSVIGGKTLIQP